MKNLIVEKKEMNSTLPINIPGDKSISHRVLMVAALFPGESKISNLNMGSAVTILKDIYKELEIPIEISASGEVTVGYLDADKIRGKEIVLQCGPSSCVARFMIGILAGLNVSCIIDGNSTLRARPMDFVVEPLNALGANIQYLSEPGCLPVKIHPGAMKDGSVHIKVDSAQASSAVFLAALTAKIRVGIFFKSHSRDHTQRLLHHLGCDYQKFEDRYILDGRKELVALNDYIVPGDPSLAAFPIAAHLIQEKESTLIIRNVCLNPTRIGILEVFIKMGADIEYKNIRNNYGEEVGDLVVYPLQKKMIPFRISGGELIHSMLDEIPLAAAVSATLDGTTTIMDAHELEFKETNRIITTKEMLTQFGVHVELIPGGMVIEGTKEISAREVDSHRDHRISMAAAVLALKSKFPVSIIDGACSETSFPGFANEMQKAGFPILEEI